jgi:hypothetical protein
MKKTSIPRYTGVPEFWFNETENKIVIRDGKYHCRLLRMKEFMGREWEDCFFKEQWSFEFYNGSKYLVEKGYKLLFRIDQCVSSDG